MYDAQRLVPRNSPPSDPKRIMEIARPAALLRSGPYDCRTEADTFNVKLSSEFVFNNATKQQRYKTMGKSDRPSPPKDVLKGSLEQGRPQSMTDAGAPQLWSKQ
jgi:hypothetical protein